MKKALFWDFDGTLTHTGPLWSHAVHEAAERECGATLPFEAVRAEMRIGFSWHTPGDDHTALIGGAWWEAMARRFSEIYRLLGLEEGQARRASLQVRGLILDPGRYTLYEDACDTLQACMDLGFENHLLSNNYPEMEEMLAELGLSPYFQSCTVSACVGFDKPHPVIFAYAKELAGEPEHCVMIGDNPQADIAGGKQAGMRTILVHRDAPDCDADFRVATLREILPFLAPKEALSGAALTNN